MCDNLHIRNRFNVYFKELQNDTLDQEHMYRAGATIVSTITSTSIIIT